MFTYYIILDNAGLCRMFKLVSRCTAVLALPLCYCFTGVHGDCCFWCWLKCPFERCVFLFLSPCVFLEEYRLNGSIFLLWEAHFPSSRLSRMAAMCLIDRWPDQLPSSEPIASCTALIGCDASRPTHRRTRMEILTDVKPSTAKETRW